VSAVALQPDLPLVEVTSRDQWRSWLQAHHDQPSGVWAVTRKRGSLSAADQFVSSRDLNEECLCFGWIDSRPAAIDEHRSALLCTPRRPGSGWSKVNKDRLQHLLDAGLVAPRGLAAIAAAKADGSWTKLDDVDQLAEPPDLDAALAAEGDARSNWDAFPSSARRGILEWIHSARRPETRAARIAETARLADRNVRANQWPRRA
jgi:uncharacterized protein YdeI (YjbR/CyaY-like superfamily)